MDWINTANGLITLITGGVALISAIVGLFFTIRAWLKAQKKNSAAEIWQTVMQAADAAMVAAEASALKGADAKQMAMDMVKGTCAAMGLDVGPFIDQLSAYIDQCIAFHNDLNSADKAKTKK